MKIRWNLGQAIEQLAEEVIFAWLFLPPAIVVCAVIYVILTAIGLPAEISIVAPLAVMVAIFIVGYAYYQRLSLGPRTVKSLKRLLRMTMKAIVVGIERAKRRLRE